LEGRNVGGRRHRMSSVCSGRRTQKECGLQWAPRTQNECGLQSWAPKTQNECGLQWAPPDGFQCVVRRQPTHLLDGRHCLKLEAAPKSRQNLNVWKHKNDTNSLKKQIPECQSTVNESCDILLQSSTGNPSGKKHLQQTKIPSTKRCWRSLGSRR
jgi:hypothetical protein